jgi:Rhodopirellula transposase DDE domain
VRPQEFFSEPKEHGLPSDGVDIVKAALDTHQYDTAIQVSDEEIARLHVTPHAFHGDWNYTISPRR